MGIFLSNRASGGRFNDTVKKSLRNDGPFEKRSMEEHLWHMKI